MGHGRVRSGFTDRRLRIGVAAFWELPMGCGAESESWWRTNKLGADGSENRGNFCQSNRQSRRGQNRRGRNGRDTESGMSGRANRAGVVGCGRVFRMRVGSLHRSHHAHQGNGEHAHGSDENTPLCRDPQHVIYAVKALSNLHRNNGQVQRDHLRSNVWPQNLPQHATAPLSAALTRIAAYRLPAFP
jgi:hypothetical protein